MDGDPWLHGNGREGIIIINFDVMIGNDPELLHNLLSSLPFPLGAWHKIGRFLEPISF
jgi:hypothetical protein